MWNINRYSTLYVEEIDIRWGSTLSMCEERLSVLVNFCSLLMGTHATEVLSLHVNRYIEVDSDKSLVCICAERNDVAKWKISWLECQSTHCFIPSKQLVVNGMPPDFEEALEKVMKILNTIKIWSLTIHLAVYIFFLKKWAY